MRRCYHLFIVAVHHFIASGRDTAELRRVAGDPERLMAAVSGMIDEHGLHVMAERAVEFPGGGLTAVWILAESHLVLHHWRREGYSTLDLHVCDYQASNLEKANGLADQLGKFCYRPGSDTWRRVVLEDPVPDPPPDSS